MRQKFPSYINRELSWIEFNERVLQEARDPEIPLLERLKFLAITATNLDEFFMVRVGSLKRMIEKNPLETDPSGLSVSVQMEEVLQRVRKMIYDQYLCYLDHIEPGLELSGIRRLSAHELTENQKKYVSNVFEEEIFPVISPMAFKPGLHPPLLLNLGLHFIVKLKSEKDARQARYAIIPVGTVLERFIRIPSETGFQYILIEEVIRMFIDRFFHDEPIQEFGLFRITRNADLSVEEEFAPDFLMEMEEIVDARKYSDCIRLETEEHFSPSLLAFLQKHFKILEVETFAIPGPLNLGGFQKIAGLDLFPELKYEPWVPRISPEIDMKESLFDILKKKNVLLLHPYESFDPVLKFINEAAEDPKVLAIKQILYRTSRNSPVVAALMKAAERGKYVTAVVELKARFDEERNIEWARKLEEAGVQVIYGVKRLKTHAKICIVIRREFSGIMRYVHFSTGNYNELTAKLYSDVSYMTSREDLGADATSFFNAITGYSQPQKFLKIEAAPLGLRSRILELIEGEIQRKSQGEDAMIMIKINALVDKEIIDALYRASQKGVKVRLNVRGICCLRPGIRGLSENIEVVSIVDRYLEHSRILYFYHAGNEKVFISSADWMPRNLDRRVELLVPVDDEFCRQRLIDVLHSCFNDNVKSRRLLANGTYERIQKGKKKLYHMQKDLYRQAVKAVEDEARARRTVFEPHRPQE